VIASLKLPMLDDRLSVFTPFPVTSHSQVICMDMGTCIWSIRHGAPFPAGLFI